MCPWIWPIEDLCIGLYVLNRLLTVWQILEKFMSMQHSNEEFSEKQRRVELRSVGNFVAYSVLVESANQFSLGELCRTQYSMKYFFRSHIDHQTYGKTLMDINREYVQQIQGYQWWLFRQDIEVLLNLSIRSNRFDFWGFDINPSCNNIYWNKSGISGTQISLLTVRLIHRSQLCSLRIYVPIIWFGDTAMIQSIFN